MPADSSEVPEDELEALLAACDDALARGDLKSSRDAVRSVEGETQERLRKQLAFVQRLRKHWRAPPANDVPAPKELGRFQIRRVLGRGGFGVVYQAFDPKLGRDVALKVPRADVALTPALRARFRTEARAAAGLDHPNIVSVFETGEVGATVYIASALCPGPSLDDWLRRRKEPVPIAHAATLIATVAEAVQHAHERNVLHRDLKPANILLQASADTGQKTDPSSDLCSPSSDLSPKITDFGLAKHVPPRGTESGAEPANLTHSGAIIGTPTYMAPEQAAGRVEEFGPASDVYSLGAILYELLTGRPPFVADSVLDVLQLVRSMDPVAPTKLRARLPRDLETICLKCLEKDPRKRYSTASELATDLRRFLAGEPIKARPLSAAGRFQRWVRRHPTRAALLVVSVVAALMSSGVVVGVVYNGRLTEANVGLATSLDQTRDARDGEATQRTRAEEALEQSEQLAYLLRVTRADFERRANRMTEARRLLEGCSPSRRGWEWYYLWDQSDDQTVEFRGHTSVVNQVALDPQHDRAATAGRDGTVRLWDTGTGQELVKLPVKQSVLSAAFDPAGERLAAATFGGLIYIWAVVPNQAPELLHTLTNHSGQVWRVVFSPDGTTLASAGNDQTVRLWDVSLGIERLALRGPTAPVVRVAFHPNGDTVLATVLSDTNAELWEWATKTGAGALKIRGGKARAFPALSVQVGGDFASVLDRDTIRFIKEPGKPQVELPRVREAISDIAFSPDDRLLALARADGVVEIVDAWTGFSLTTLPRHQGRVESIAFDPRGKRIASAGADGRVMIARAVPGRPPLYVTAPDGYSWSVAFHPNGRELALGGSNGTIRFVDPATGALAAHAHPPLADHKNGQFVSALAYGPDGAALGACWRGASTARVWIEGKNGIDLAHRSEVTALAFHPNGQQVATASGNEVRLWDVATGREQAVLKAPTRAVGGLTFGPDGARLFGTGGKGLGLSEQDWVWELSTYKLTPTPRDGTEAMAAPPAVLLDGWVPGRSGFGLSLYDSAGNRSSRTVFKDGVTDCWAAHPDRRRLAVGRAGNTVALWDTITDAELLTLPVGTMSPFRLAFDPTGRRLAVIDRIGLLWIWDAPPIQTP